MRPGVFAITLAVADLERSLRFYRDGLGLASPGIVGTEFPGDDEHPAGAAAMFTMDDGLVLSLYPATELAKDARLPLDAVRGHGFSLGHRVGTRAEVDAVLAAAEAAGATITAPADDRPWRIYSGYFADPDGHLWEVVCFLGD
jgi:catechol 2,3-dioxygenase-like lactoylglutathione lyase family enzyme